MYYLREGINGRLLLLTCLLACWMLVGCGGGDESSTDDAAAVTETTASAPSLSEIREIEDCLREGGAKIREEGNKDELYAEGPDEGFIALIFFDDLGEGMEFAEGIDGTEGTPGAGERVVRIIDDGRIVISFSMSPSTRDEDMTVECVEAL